MKKVLSIMLVLCVAASLFAVGSVRVGAAFDFVSGKTPDFVIGEKTMTNSARQYKTSGIGFDVSAKYDLSSDLSVFADFNMTFNFDFKVKTVAEENWSSLNKFDSRKLNSLSVAAGVAYKLPLTNAPVNVSVGGGLFYERNLGYISESFNNKFNHIGLTAYADVTYMINDKIGVGVSAMPRIGLFDFDSLTRVTEGKASGFAFSFGMPVSVGASYSF